MKSQESHGIRINCINPEGVDAGVFLHLKEGCLATASEFEELLKVHIPLR